MSQASDNDIVAAIQRGLSATTIRRELRVGSQRVQEVGTRHGLDGKMLENRRLAQARQHAGHFTVDEVRRGRFLELWNAKETAVEIAYQMGWTSLGRVYGFANELRARGVEVCRRRQVQ